MSVGSAMTGGSRPGKQGAKGLGKHCEVNGRSAFVMQSPAARRAGQHGGAPFGPSAETRLLSFVGDRHDCKLRP